MADELELKTESLALVQYGNNFVAIKDQDDFALACEYLTQNKAQQKKICEKMDPLIKAANDTHKKAVALKKEIIDPVIYNYYLVAGATGAWTEEQDRIQKAEQKRLDDEDRKKEEEAKAVIVAAAEKEEKDGNEQGATDLMEQAQDYQVPAAKAPEVITKFKGGSGSISFNDVLEITVTDPIAVYNAVRSGTFPIGCVEIKVKVSVLEGHFKGKGIATYNANGVTVKTVKKPVTRT